MRGHSFQQPSESYAADEQHRADGLARMIGDIQSRPDSALHRVLPHYQAAYQDAAGNAAAHTGQPERRD